MKLLLKRGTPVGHQNFSLRCLLPCLVCVSFWFLFSSPGLIHLPYLVDSEFGSRNLKQIHVDVDGNIININDNNIEQRRGQEHLEMMEGPSFTRVTSSLPRPVIEFYNNSGLELVCQARGRPHPSVSWLTLGKGINRYHDSRLNPFAVDLSPVTEVSGLRHLRRDASILILPFSAENYSQEVHSTSYYCMASNPLGSIISHEIRIRAGKILLYLFLCHTMLFVSERKRERERDTV